MWGGGARHRLVAPGAGLHPPAETVQRPRLPGDTAEDGEDVPPQPAPMGGSPPGRPPPGPAPELRGEASRRHCSGRRTTASSWRRSRSATCSGCSRPSRSTSGTCRRRRSRWPIRRRPASKASPTAGTGAGPSTPGHRDPVAPPPVPRDPLTDAKQRLRDVGVADHSRPAPGPPLAVYRRWVRP